MLFVLNKGKICAYIVSVLTVVFLFCATMLIQNDSENTVPTSTNTSATQNKTYT